MKKALVLGGGGFIGARLVEKLKEDGFFVRAADMKHPEFAPTVADEFIIGDLRIEKTVATVIDQPFDEVYQLAADMGGAGYLFTGDNDADVISNSALINLFVARQCAKMQVGAVLFSSSACIYPVANQLDPDNPDCAEDTAYPANPDSEYGWEKLFSERLFDAYARNYGLNAKIVRFHNVFGPFGTWDGGKEKVPSALCRKVAEAADGSDIEIWGDGLQTRSFLYVDECIDGMIRMIRSPHRGPVNIGSDEMVSINELARRIIAISGKTLGLKHVVGPVGVRGRNSDNRLITELLDWAPSQSLDSGLQHTYAWIKEQVKAKQDATPMSA